MSTQLPVGTRGDDGYPYHPIRSAKKVEPIKFQFTPNVKRVVFLAAVILILIWIGLDLPKEWAYPLLGAGVLMFGSLLWRTAQRKLTT